MHPDNGHGTRRRNLADEALVQEVLDSFSHCASPRFQEIVQSLVNHLHAFLREVNLTEEEWRQAVDFLTRTGQISTDKRQEFILLSDTLGASMQVIGINNRKVAGATEATVFGPFYVKDSPHWENGDDIAQGAPGEPCFVDGTVRGLDGTPIPGAQLEIWQADEDGLYDVQKHELSGSQGRGQLNADADGRFYFRTIKPEPYPIPSDGPVGDLLKAAQRSPMRPAHIHFRIQATGYDTLTTHVFQSGDPYIDSDAVFGVKDSLIAEFQRAPQGPAPDGTPLDTPFWTMHYDFVLMPSTPNKEQEAVQT
jgi:hydroxyquinol 1,2-dioxygenase